MVYRSVVYFWHKKSMEKHGQKQTGNKILHNIKERYIAFFLSFVFVFIFTLVVLTVLDAVPTPRVAEVETTNGQPDVEQPVRLAEDPIRIKVSAIDLDDKVLNPTNADNAVLDAALLKGTVRYPGSARLGEIGNVLIFGHSSYLSTVLNQNYKAFNDIQKLKTGEIITVYSGTTAYEYEVSAVKYVKAEEGVIDLSKVGKRLTLVTCNSFASKSDRFVVEANFVKSYSVRS